MAAWRNRHKHFLAWVSALPELSAVPCEIVGNSQGCHPEFPECRRSRSDQDATDRGIPGRSSPLDPQQSILAQDSLMPAETFAAELDDFPSIAF